MSSAVHATILLMPRLPLMLLLPRLPSGSLTVAAHELGHSMGFGHVNKRKMKGNIMHSGGSKNGGVNSTESQILEIESSYNSGSLNQGQQDIDYDNL